MIADIEQRHSQATRNIPHVIDQIFTTGAALPIEEIRGCFTRGGLNLRELRQNTHATLCEAAKAAISYNLPMWEGGPIDMEATLKNISAITAEVAFTTMRLTPIPGGAPEIQTIPQTSKLPDPNRLPAAA